VRKLLPLALLLCGCATAFATARTLAPTLYVENLTDDQLAIYVSGRHAAIAKVPSLGTACIRLTDLPPGDVVLGFRPLAKGILRAMPTNYETDPGWALTLTSASHDDGFFAHPAPRCRG
jgi:hypothetical protein